MLLLGSFHTDGLANPNRLSEIFNFSVVIYSAKVPNNFGLYVRTHGGCEKDSNCYRGACVDSIKEETAVNDLTPAKPQRDDPLTCHRHHDPQFAFGVGSTIYLPTLGLPGLLNTLDGDTAQRSLQNDDFPGACV